MSTTPHREGPPVPLGSLTVRLARERHRAVGRNRIYEAIASGALLGIKVGRRLAIPIEALDAWVLAGAPLEAEDAGSGPLNNEATGDE